MTTNNFWKRQKAFSLIYNFKYSLRSAISDFCDVYVNILYKLLTRCTNYNNYLEFVSTFTQIYTTFCIHFILNLFMHDSLTN